MSKIVKKATVKKTAPKKEAVKEEAKVAKVEEIKVEPKEMVKEAEKKTNAEIIWDDIKNRNINMFSMICKVSSYCNSIPLDPTRCFLTLKVSSVLASLEDELGKEYDFELIDKYVAISKKVKKETNHGFSR